MKGTQATVCHCHNCREIRRRARQTGTIIGNTLRTCNLPEPKGIGPSAVAKAAETQKMIADWEKQQKTASPKQAEVISAPGYLVAAGKHLTNRAATYDAPEGERSMERTVAAFNTLKGTNLSIADGWTFMMLLKMVRADQGDFKSDNFEDLVAYAALLGEQASIDAVRALKQQSV